jgi:VIT1/CCC1 family predicted Fe2+/Mn2+ transporter
MDELLATQLADHFMSDPERALRAHAREELGIDVATTASPWQASSFSLITFALGAFLPLLPWLLTSHGDQLWWSVGVSTFGSFTLGGLTGYFTERGVVRSGLRQLAVTTLAAGVTWAVGAMIGR